MMWDRVLLGLVYAWMILGIAGIVRGLFVFRKQMERYRQSPRKRF
jgi:uncharacterized protein YneF (UPF0154 family)